MFVNKQGRRTNHINHQVVTVMCQPSQHLHPSHASQRLWPTPCFFRVAFGSPRHAATPPYHTQKALNKEWDLKKSERPRCEANSSWTAEKKKSLKPLCNASFASKSCATVAAAAAATAAAAAAAAAAAMAAGCHCVGLPTKSGGLCWTARFRCIRVSQRRAKQRAKAAELAAQAAASAAIEEEELAAQTAAAAAIEEARRRRIDV